MNNFNPNKKKNGFALTEAILAITAILIVGIGIYSIYSSARSNAISTSVKDTLTYILSKQGAYTTMLRQKSYDSRVWFQNGTTDGNIPPDTPEESVAKNASLNFLGFLKSMGELPKGMRAMPSYVGGNGLPPDMGGTGVEQAIDYTIPKTQMTINWLTDGRQIASSVNASAMTNTDCVILTKIYTSVFQDVDVNGTSVQNLTWMKQPATGESIALGCTAALASLDNGIFFVNIRGQSYY